MRLPAVLMLGVGLSLLGSACAGPNKRALDYRNKARERFSEGKYDLALADYKKAEELDKKNKIDGLGGERERAAQEHVRKLLKESWADYNNAKFLDAYRSLAALKLTNAWGVRLANEQVVRSLGDAAAQAMKQFEALRKQRKFLYAFLLGQYLVKELPPTHSLRVRVEAVKVAGINFHTSKMRSLQQDHPAAAAFHYLIAQRLGANQDSDGLGLLAAVKATTGDPTKLVAAAVAETEEPTPDAGTVEDLLVQARQAGTAWDPSAGKFFGARYGLEDQKLLEDVWSGTTTFEVAAVAVADKLPEPDDIAERASSEPSSSSDSGPRPKSMDLSFNAGSHMLASSTLSTGAGGAFRFPNKSGKFTYELSGFFESRAMGGDVDGYGGEFLVSTLVKAPLVLGAGIGYLEDERVFDAVAMVTPPPIRQKSIHIPIVARVPLFEGYVASAEWRANLLQAAKKDDAPLDEPLHYSPLTLRLYGPIPVLADASSVFRKIVLEGYATYTKDADKEFTFGGRLIYRSTMGVDEKESSGDDLWDKVEKSMFATQTLLGPTWDFWLAVGGSALKPDTNAVGMGTLFRIPNKDSKTVYEFSTYFESSSLGGNVGGWGIEYMALKTIKTFGVFGYGLGYSSSSISEADVGADPMAPMPEQNSFHSPVVLRFPLTTNIVAGLEGRLNWLQLGGTNCSYRPTAGQGCNDPANPMRNETRHFTPLVARIWMPIPILGDALSVFNKFHLEGHIGYTLGADKDKGDAPFNYGGMVVWRPINEKKF